MNPIIKMIIPKYVKEKMISFGINEMKKKWNSEDEKIEKFELSKKHIHNIKVLGNRNDLIKLLPTKGIVAEIGVFKGDFSKTILEIAEPTKLHLIDKWDSKQYPSSLKTEVKERFKTEILSGKIEINEGYSIETAKEFEDNYFDWIYLDTDHSYEVTIKELEAYRPKVKKGGIIAGHDFIIGNWNDMVKYGVKEAVYEFCCKNEWEIIYLTMENQEHPSFALKKI